MYLFLPAVGFGADGGQPPAAPGDTYQVRSAFSAGLVLNLEEFGLRDFRAPDFPWDWFQKMIGEAKRLRPYFLGDSYPLTPCAIAPEAWAAYQLLVPGKQEGAVVVFRRAESPMSAASFQLHGLLATDTYMFEGADNGKTLQATGHELMATGLAVLADIPRTSRLLFYNLFSRNPQGGMQGVSRIESRSSVLTLTVADDGFSLLLQSSEEIMKSVSISSGAGIARAKPVFECAHGADFSFGGIVGDRIKANLDNWLLVAPKANPAMLEMF